MHRAIPSRSPGTPDSTEITPSNFVKTILVRFVVLGALFALAGCSVEENTANQPVKAADTPVPDSETSQLSPQSRMLTIEWPGPYHGVPPVDVATPDSMEMAFREAVAVQRDDIDRIANNLEPPTFKNTIAALEESNRAIERISALTQIFISTASNDEVREMAANIAPLQAGMADEIAHNQALFARIKVIHAGLPDSAPTPEAGRLVTVIYNKLIHLGAELNSSEKARLGDINKRLAQLHSQFSQNLAQESETLVIYVDDVADLEGLSAADIESASVAAVAAGRPETWAIPMTRPAVWPVLTHANSRLLREQVWRMWVSRGRNSGEFDNRPVMTEILQLRGQKATMMGYPSFAHYQTSTRMAGTPEVALEMLEKTWRMVLGPTIQNLADMQALADSEGEDFPIETWDRLYYAEKLRKQRFDVNMDDIKPYLQLETVMEAIFWAAQETYGWSLRKLSDVPVVSPDIDVYEVTRAEELIGVVWIDVIARQGKRRGSWAVSYRSAESFQGKRVPLVALHSSAEPGLDGGPTLLPWEVANVLFHEFGHNLHTLANRAAYPSLGSLDVPWDFVEVPSLLNERWFMSRKVLTQFARHHQTGDPIPAELIDRIEQVTKHNRVFSVTLEYLLSAITDMKIHMMADGRDIDAIAVEKESIESLRTPASIDPLLHVSHATHTFTAQYAAGVYTYLWSDVIAADIAEAFLEAPGGLFDRDVAVQYEKTILGIGFTVPTEQAFRNFRGRDPDPEALMRRFDLIAPEE